MAGSGPTRTSTTPSSSSRRTSSRSASDSTAITGTPATPGYDAKEQHTPNPTADYISEPNAILLRDTYNGKTQWDEVEHTPWFYIDRDQMREWVFYTDKRAFMDRFNLAKQTGVEGICAWDLGDEDPAIWPAIPDKR